MFKLFQSKRDSMVNDFILKTRKNNELEYSESRLSCLLNQLRGKLNNNEEANKNFNRLLIERAVVRKKLRQSRSKNVIALFCEKIGTIGEKKTEKLICDYFKNK